MLVKFHLGLLFVCISLGCLQLRGVNASEGHEDHGEVTELVEKVASEVCGLSHTSTFNATCFNQVIINLFQRLAWFSPMNNHCPSSAEVESNKLGNKLFANHNTGGVVTMEDLEKISLSLIVLTMNVNGYCKNTANVVEVSTYTNYWSAMSSDAKFKASKTSWLEHIFEHFSSHSNKTMNTKCITSKAIIAESKASSKTTDEEWAKTVSLFTILHVLNGYQLDTVCVELPTSASILNSLYNTLGLPSSNSRIPESGIKKIMTALGIGNGASSSHAGHGHDHEGHDHRRKRSVDRLIRVRRATTVFANNQNVTQCLSVDNLFAVFGVDENAGTSLNQLKNLCPAMLQQKLSGACDPKPTIRKRLSDAEAYGYGAIAVFIISFGSLLGAIFIPCIKTKAFDLIMLYSVTLAIGTLLSDSLMHLIPEAVGLHVHAHSKTFQPPSPYFWKMFALICVIFVLYVIELILSFWFPTASHPHGHSHGGDLEMTPQDNIGFQNSVSDMTEPELVGHKQSGDGAVQESLAPEKAAIHHEKVKSSRVTAIFVIGGDSIHNFADGLAIGAAFSSSLSSGLSTSIAIMCHELPHELGDFAVLLSSNLSVKKALLINLFSAFTAFIGFFIGVPIGVNEEARQWIFTVTAGMFIYISLCNMLSTTKNTRPSKKMVSFVTQVGGFLTGIIIILIIGLFEGQIQV